MGIFTSQYYLDFQSIVDRRTYTTDKAVKDLAFVGLVPSIRADYNDRLQLQKILKATKDNPAFNKQVQAQLKSCTYSLMGKLGYLSSFPPVAAGYAYSSGLLMGYGLARIAFFTGLFLGKASLAENVKKPLPV
jgi:hypothetical protein